MAHTHSESVCRLFEDILRLETREECEAFFEDLCTVRELEDMAQRLDAARLLDHGMNYQEISERVGISTATISRVSKCLKYGSGYKAALTKEQNAESEVNE